MAMDVFVSVGRTCNTEQEKFVQAVEEHLRSNGMIPRAVGRSDFSSAHPLKFIEQLMRQCEGTVIIAFERIHLQDALEKRGSVNEKLIKNVNLPTVWNQIEAAMAYVLGQPLLVIVEDGLRNEGLLEAGYDWYVQRVNLNEAALTSKEFVGIFSDWKKRVEQNNLNKSKEIQDIDFDQITIGKLVTALKPSQLYSVIGALIALLSAVATAAYYIGQNIAQVSAK